MRSPVPFPDTTRSNAALLFDQHRAGAVPFITVVDSASYKDRAELTPLSFANMLRRHDYYTKPAPRVGTPRADCYQGKAGETRRGLAITLPWSSSKGTGIAWEAAVSKLPAKNQKR